jgi:hypothetical protein
MKRAIRAVAAPTLDANASAMRSLAAALAPHLRELLAAERSGAELVDVLEAVPGPRRSIMRAARSGKIRGSVRVGRRWLAPREAINEWLTSVGPRSLSAATSDEDGDELEPLRRRLLAGGSRR